MCYQQRRRTVEHTLLISIIEIAIVEPANEAYFYLPGDCVERQNGQVTLTVEHVHRG